MTVDIPDTLISVILGASHAEAQRALNEAVRAAHMAETLRAMPPPMPGFEMLQEDPAHSVAEVAKLGEQWIIATEFAGRLAGGEKTLSRERWLDEWRIELQLARRNAAAGEAA